MRFSETPLKGSYIIELTPFADTRGWFARTFCKNEFAQIGHSKEWVQLNHSFTNSKGAIRGMHFQYPPHTEIKMVRCIAGAVFDVIIDIRKDSDTFLQYFGAELSAQNKRMLYIPDGFAHGFQTLADNTELIYHHTAFYTPAAEGGIRYNDPKVGIDWILPDAEISERDKEHPYLDNTFKGLIL
ncbi:MAG: dTDP-4-dehydrorhamnose 3,5-epimerase [Chitinophagaceae bacterium]